MLRKFEDSIEETRSLRHQLQKEPKDLTQNALTDIPLMCEVSVDIPEEQ